MAEGLGFKPRSRASKARVLSLNEPPVEGGWRGRKDSNLRMPGSEPGAVAAEPRPYRSFASTMRVRRYLVMRTHAPGLTSSSVASVPVVNSVRERLTR